MEKQKISVFWFRRDLRLFDNHGLSKALDSGLPVLPLFIFDTNILNELPKDDHRVNFIYDTLESINRELSNKGSGLLIKKGDPLQVLKALIDAYPISKIFFNHDYEPYALDRDEKVKHFLKEKGIEVASFKDQVIFEKDEVLKPDGSPYTIYSPYKKRWRQLFSEEMLAPYIARKGDFYQNNETPFPSKETLGIVPSKIAIRPYKLEGLKAYKSERDFPGIQGTSEISPYLRFGIVSIRDVMKRMWENETYINELIWRSFFMQILYHFPNVLTDNFKSQYDGIKWRNNEAEFDLWKAGKTGYPMVDAGMRELQKTGYMHNRVRMVVASFLCKHLLIDWRWGESYFAEKLFDFELSSNNGNWQWAAGTGCDAAPYFRVFNPIIQKHKFDPDDAYVKKWIPEWGTADYPRPIVQHDEARDRALKEYKVGLNN